MADRLFSNPALNAIYNCETSYNNECTKIGENVIELSMKVSDSENNPFPVRVQVQVEGDDYRVMWWTKGHTNQSINDNLLDMLSQIIVRNRSTCKARFAQTPSPRFIVEISGTIEDLVEPAEKRTAYFYRKFAEVLHLEILDMCCVPVSFTQTIKAMAEKAKTKQASNETSEDEAIESKEPEIRVVKETVVVRPTSVNVPPVIKVPGRPEGETPIPVKRKSSGRNTKLIVLIASIGALVLLISVFLLIYFLGGDDDTGTRRKKKNKTDTEISVDLFDLPGNFDLPNNIIEPDDGDAPDNFVEPVPDDKPGVSLPGVGDPLPNKPDKPSGDAGTIDHASCDHAAVATMPTWPAESAPITLMSDEAAMVASMGSDPTNVVEVGDDKYCYYGTSYFYISKSTICGWHTGDTALHVFQQENIPGSYFEIGSTRRDVLNAMGTPTCHEWSETTYRWYYGSSYVEFSNGYVSNVGYGDTPLFVIE